MNPAHGFTMANPGSWVHDGEPRLVGSRWRTQARGFTMANPGSWVRREPSSWVHDGETQARGFTMANPGSWVRREPSSWVHDGETQARGFVVNPACGFLVNPRAGFLSNPRVGFVENLLSWVRREPLKLGTSRTSRATFLAPLGFAWRTTLVVKPIDIMAEDPVANQAIRTLKEYASPSIEGTVSSIRRLAVKVNNFEIKPATIQMIQQSVQFCGLPSDDPNAHIANFLEICDTFKYNGVSDDAVRLRLFSFSLRDKAKNWLNSLPVGLITTWDMMAQKFLSKFFLPAKTAKMRNDIATFVQLDMESLYEAWERYKKLLRKCPHHGLPIWLQVHTFYNGLFPNNRTMLDAAVGGSLMSKHADESYNLIEEMASNSYQWGSERSHIKKNARIYGVDAFTALTAQIEFQSQEVATKSLEATVQNQGASIQNLEAQVGQLASVVSGRAQGVLPSSTKKNPKEQVKAVTLRSEKQIGDEESSDNKGEKVKAPTEEKKSEVPSKESEEVKSYVPPIPFPHRLKQQKLDKQFAKFLDIFKKLHINIPFADALAQMPSYAKFLKEIVSNKRKLEEYETVKLTEECSAILQNKLPPKLKDPGKDCPDLLETCVVHSKDITVGNEDIREYAFHLEACPPFLNSKEPSIQDFRANMPRLKPSLEEPPKLELKPLPV
ncbi:hypothetical protein SLEP1_g34363 [Rubroshorea leprosula]|uniref:Retrotransposon gag domain-containing protein n=1 Tax=Rubroshorea leprosula TaxID=152421 RepID=A0AAV5KJU6_9ROSI|nr:hypothetical protein SLEP1_g34363 [Rubroshorea leprosula]